MSDCIFCKIAHGETPAEVFKENDAVCAFNDQRPQAPTHILIITKNHYSGIAAMADSSLIGELVAMANEIAREKGLDAGYRLVINQGPDGGQNIDHTHLHLLAGRKLNWPPG